MSWYADGHLIWDRTDARSPRWVLLLDGEPGVASWLLDPGDPSIRQDAGTSQLVHLIRTTLQHAYGHRPRVVTLMPRQYRHRLWFHATF